MTQKCLKWISDCTYDQIPVRGSCLQDAVIQWNVLLNWREIRLVDKYRWELVPLDAYVNSCGAALFLVTIITGSNGKLKKVGWTYFAGPRDERDFVRFYDISREFRKGRLVSNLFSIRLWPVPMNKVNPAGVRGGIPWWVTFMQTWPLHRPK